MQESSTNLNRLKSASPRRLLIVVACVLIGVTLLASAGYLYLRHMSQPSTILFTSSRLGISFSHISAQGGDAIATREVGDTIYVYDTKLPYLQGQYVQVFVKDPQDTLEQAITQIVLKGFNLHDCPIGPARVALSYPATYKLASIRYAVSHPDPNGGWPIVDETKCPKGFTELPDAGIAYFLVDTQHPAKLFFFYIGLSAIQASADSSNSLLWQETLKAL